MLWPRLQCFAVFCRWRRSPCCCRLLLVGVVAVQFPDWLLIINYSIQLNLPFKSKEWPWFNLSLLLLSLTISQARRWSLSEYCPDVYINSSNRCLFQIVMASKENLCIINGLLTKCGKKMARYWPHSYFGRLWTLTPSWSMHQNENEANIQPSWPCKLDR